MDGPPEYCYKLRSIVSHFGASTTAGHYVADVYMFDAGSWFRYDDTVVTETKDEEEADMQRALELSTQEISDSNEAAVVESNQQVPESTEDVADDHDSVVDGPPEYCYKLSSIVSHFGASTTAGHYVADVYRFDAGSWFRYDDTVVTETNDVAVR